MSTRVNALVDVGRRRIAARRVVLVDVVVDLVADDVAVAVVGGREEGEHLPTARIQVVLGDGGHARRLEVLRRADVQLGLDAHVAAHVLHNDAVRARAGDDERAYHAVEFVLDLVELDRDRIEDVGDELGREKRAIERERRLAVEDDVVRVVVGLVASARRALAVLGRYGLDGRGEDHVVAGAERRRERDVVLDAVLEGDAREARRAVRIVEATYDQAQVDLRVGVAIERLIAAAGREELDLELMHARLLDGHHVDLGAVRVVVEVRRLARLGPVGAHLAYGDVVEVLEHVLERDPEAAVVVEIHAHLGAYVTRPLRPAVGPVAAPLFVSPRIS